MTTIRTTIIRRKFYEAMKELEIPRKLIELVKMTLQAPKNKMKIEGELTMEFNVNKGLRQMAVLSMNLFNLELENVLRKLPVNPGGT